MADQNDWPLNKNNMPDLSKLNSKKSLTQAMMRFFVGGGSKDPVAASLATNFVRLTDHLIFEYENCRLSLNEFIAHGSQGHFSPYFRAVCHMESAVTTMQRSIRLARKIRSWKHEPRLPIDKKITVLSDAVEKRVREVRDSIEHIYNQITNGTPRKNAMACLVLLVDHFECEGKKISYSNFASWITQLDPIALQVAEFKETPQTE